MRVIVTLVAASVMAASSAPAYANPSDTWQHCREAVTRAGVISDLMALNVTCRTATRLGRRWQRSCVAESCRVGTFRCRTTPVEVEQVRVRCGHRQRPERKVRFEYGV